MNLKQWLSKVHDLLDFAYKAFILVTLTKNSLLFLLENTF